MDSILNQTYRQFRLLIVDDASTDDTRRIVRSYGDRRIELLCFDQNVGQTAALNIGLRHASTPWIARMDADDYSASIRLEEQMRTLAEDPSLSCVGTGIWEFREDPRVVDVVKFRPQHHGAIKRAALYGSGMIHGSIVVSRRALLDIGGYNERYRYAADRDMFIRLLAKYRAMNLRKSLVGIRRHPNQDSFSKQAADEYIEVFSRLLSADGYSRAEIDILRESLAYSYLFRARCLRLQGLYYECWKDLARAVQLSPSTYVRYLLGTVSRHVLSERMQALLRRDVLNTR
jgi:glycosyltransferase involved in cell wall biosynthesis